MAVAGAYREWAWRLTLSWGQRLAPLSTLVGVIIAWEVGVRALDVPLFLFPTPSGVAGTFLENPTFILGHLAYTATASVVGFLLAAVFGILLSVAIAYSRTLETVVYPYLVITRVIPIVAIAPLLAIWFGFGMTPKIVVAFFIAFFPIVVNMVLGLKSPDRELLNLMRSLNASEFKTFVKIRIPFSLPLLFASFRIAAPGTVIAAIVAEFIGSDKGIGYVIQLAKGYLDTELIFLAIFASALLGIGMFVAVVLAERKLLYWHESRDY